MKKYTAELVENIIKKLGYTWVEGEYKNNVSKLTLKDKQGYYYFVCLNQLNNGIMPYFLNLYNPYIIQNIKLWLKLNHKPYELITKIYKRNNEKLTLKDKEGYFYMCSMSALQQGNIPRFVDKCNLYSIQNIKLWCKINNKPFQLVSDKYNGTNDNTLQWRCLKDGCGEIFNMSWCHIQRGEGCSYCAGKRISLSNCLATKNPELAKEWHPTKNENLTPYDVTCGMSKRVWWKCKECGHEWKTSIRNRNAGSICFKCSMKNTRGENHPNWKGGTTLLQHYLRDATLKQWKKDSMQNCNYKCVITNKRFDAIHHLYGFDLILQEIFKETRIDKRESIKDYTEEELKILKEKCIEIHNRYPLGVCLSNDIHTLFHKEYGRGNNTPEQFYQFIEKYKINLGGGFGGEI